MRKAWWVNLPLTLLTLWAFMATQPCRAIDLQAIEPHFVLPGCPPLPEAGPAGQVSLYVSKAQELGVVCVQAINGLSTSILPSGTYFRLQRREQGQFRDIPEPAPPPGVWIGANLGHFEWKPGAIINKRLFADQTSPLPGQYRVCFHYQMAVSEQGTDLAVCSEEFSLP